MVWEAILQPLSRSHLYQQCCILHRCPNTMQFPPKKPLSVDVLQGLPFPHSASYRESQGTPKWQYQLQQLHLSPDFSSTPLTTYDTWLVPSYTLQHQFVQEKGITTLPMGNVATPHKCLRALFNHTLNFCRIVRCVFGGWLQDGEPCMACWMSSMERICMICCTVSCEGAHRPTLWSRTGHSRLHTQPGPTALSWPRLIAH